MGLAGSSDSDNYLILVNDEGQYCLWERNISVPSGWKKTDVMGSKLHCLKQVSEIWTDMRPRTLRE
jgi:MbtH protein